VLLWSIEPRHLTNLAHARAPWATGFIWLLSITSIMISPSISLWNKCCFAKKRNDGFLGVVYLFCILLPFFHCFVIHMSQEWDIDVQTSQFQFGKSATIAFSCPCICVDRYAHWPWQDRRFLRWFNHLLPTDHFSLVIIVTTSNLTNHICWRPCQGRCNVHERQHRFSDYSYCKIWHHRSTIPFCRPV
jgi:hypothetical protein